MKKPKQVKKLAGKNDTEFSSGLTPDINGGRRSCSHPDRFPDDRNRADDIPHLGSKGGATYAGDMAPLALQRCAGGAFF